MPRKTTEKVECPFCGSRLSSVGQTYNIKFRGKTMIIRRRECVHCKCSYKTKETVVPEDDETQEELPSLSTSKKQVPKSPIIPVKNPFLEN